uniref:ELMO domain-containing protein n=1 Tax=Parastrongyloides trichosuri TaxID=131310 RepID=A0A0N4Z0T3_PARTI
MPELILNERGETILEWIIRKFLELNRKLLNKILILLGFKKTLYGILDTPCSYKASTTIKVENYFRNCDSKTYRLLEWESGNESDEASIFLEEDDETIGLHDHLKDKLKISMKQIKAYHYLICLVEGRRSRKYDSTNNEHEEKLYELWELLKENEKLEGRRSKQWEEIGFQGNDPATDFRGMGILGLEQLIYYAKNDTKSCLRFLHLSQHPTKGFPFAICGITISYIAKELLNRGHLKRHFYNNIIYPREINIDDFNDVYIKLFNLFSDYWFFCGDNRNIMNFNIVKEEFIDIIQKYCSKDNANLNLCYSMKDVY